MLALLAVVVAPVGAGAETDAEAEQREVADRRTAVEAELDVLQASDAEIDEALDELDRSVAAQERAVADAEAAAEAAATAVRDARIELRRATRQVVLLERAIAEMAVASFMHPPTADLVRSLDADSLSDAVLQRTYLDARARRDVALLGRLEQAESQATQRAADLEAASVEAERSVAAASEALAALHAEQQRQVAFAVDLQDRIDASLAEAAVLAELDAELADQIAAEQAALIARLPPVPVAPPPAPAPVTLGRSPTTEDRPTTTTTTAAQVDDDEPADQTEVDDAPEPTAPRPTVTTQAPPLRTVRGITVHAAIADDVEALLVAAEADGIDLSGWGYRSTERQIDLRIAHCGPTEYDIWYRPASLCRPPTAVPGRSLHEQGRAIDFTYEGRTITSRSSPGFRWLADNAATYGLFNLPSEPWHWSTSGS